MDLAAALAHLDAHDNLEAGASTPTAGVVHGLSLDRMRGIVDVLGDPQDAAPVIHITGTNGKGSTARMVAAILGAHGLVAGTYSSPHLTSVTERIRRGAESIPDDDFADVVGEIAALEPLFPDRPSWFDLVTATAFAWFAREAVDVVVLEVGMLGRFDSTNVAHADVAVVTNIGRDHTDGVGDWRRAIAHEKAGIVEPDSAVVIGETDPALVEVIRSEGGRRHLVRDADFGIRSGAVAIGGRHIDLYTPASRLDELYLPLHGAHQVDNAACAVAAVEAFFDRQLDPDVVAEGLRSVEVPARFEVLARSPLVVVDVAHNPDGTAAAARTLAEEFRVEGALTLALGLLTGRDAEATFAPLLALGPRRVACVRPESARAMDPAEVAAVVARLRPEAEVQVLEHPAQVADRLLGRLDPADALLVTGSTYLVGAARAALVEAIGR